MLKLYFYTQFIITLTFLSIPFCEFSYFRCLFN